MISDTKVSESEGKMMKLIGWKCASVVVAGAGAVLALSGCGTFGGNGSFAGLGLVPSASGSGRSAVFAVRAICDPATNQVSGAFMFGDPGVVIGGQQVRMNGNTTSAPYWNAHCTNSLSEGHYLGSYGGANGGAFQVDFDLTGHLSYTDYSAHDDCGQWQWLCNMEGYTPPAPAQGHLDCPAGHLAFRLVARTGPFAGYTNEGCMTHGSVRPIPMNAPLPVDN